MSFKLIQEEIQRGIDGKNNSVPTGFHRLSKFISIRRRVYTLIFGQTGTGKSAMVHQIFILNAFDWWCRNKNTTDIRIKVILFSQERSKIYYLTKWLCRKIFIDTGNLIPMGKMLGWWDDKLSMDEKNLINMYGEYIDELCEFVDIIEGAQNPTGIYKYVKDYALHPSIGRKEEISEFKKVYIPTLDTRIVIPIVDTLGNTKLEKGISNKKEAVDKVSEFFQYFRDFFGFSPVAISQMTRNLSNPIYSKLDSFEPTIDDAKESGRPNEDADCILSLFQPSRYKTTDSSYDVSRFINTDTGDDYFRKIKVLKNTYGISDVGIGVGFLGEVGTFKELPKKADMENFDYQSLFNHSYFLT